MDVATVVGIVCAFALVFSAIMLGGDVVLFFDVPSLMIVLGGTFGATLINYPLPEILRVLKVVKNAFFHRAYTVHGLISSFVSLAGTARREGILALENSIGEMRDEFMKKGLQLSVDGLEPNSIREILGTEIISIQERHKLGSEIFTTLGTFAPALGMIGTLIGLVQMLKTMDDPSSIGPSMAVALLTTFYGAILANLFCLPVAGKLKTRSSQEVMMKELMTEGIIAIAKGDNPRIIEQKLNAYLPLELRETSFN
jgi:chemotaxis protein MotA